MISLTSNIPLMVSTALFLSLVMFMFGIIYYLRYRSNRIKLVRKIGKAESGQVQGGGEERQRFRRRLREDLVSLLGSLAPKAGQFSRLFQDAFGFSEGGLSKARCASNIHGGEAILRPSLTPFLLYAKAKDFWCNELANNYRPCHLFGHVGPLSSRYLASNANCQEKRNPERWFCECP